MTTASLICACPFSLTLRDSCCGSFCSSLLEQLNHFSLPLILQICPRESQCGVPMHVSLVYMGTPLQQSAHNDCGTTLRGQHQGCPTMHVLLVDLCTLC